MTNDRDNNVPTPPQAGQQPKRRLSLVPLALAAAAVLVAWQLVPGLTGGVQCSLSPPARDHQTPADLHQPASATGKVRHLNTGNFASEIASGVVVVDFWAAWCGPCRMMSPVIDDLAERLDGRAMVAKVNVDEAPELARRFGISAIPSVVILQDGQEVGRYVGVQPAQRLLDAVNQAISRQSDRAE